MQGWRNYVQGNASYRFVRLHPKIKQQESLTNSLNELAVQATHTVYLYPGDQEILLGINNFFYKVWNDWIQASFNHVINPEKIYNNWPVSKNTPITQVPTWIMREFLSYYLMPAWFDQIEWNHTATWSHPNTIVVNPRNLLFDFSTTLLEIKEFCNLEYLQPIESLLPCHAENLKLQKYTDHDRICYQIINSAIYNTDLTWATLSLPSEAWIQWKLRDLGYEIMCDGLDTFPTNSVQLKKILYQP